MKKFLIITLLCLNVYAYELYGQAAAGGNNTDSEQSKLAKETGHASAARSITIHGRNGILIPGKERFFAAMLNDDWRPCNSYNDDVRWMLEGTVGDVAVNSKTGELTVGSDAATGEITITAFLSSAPSIRSQKRVVLTDGKPAAIEIIGPSALMIPSETVFIAMKRDPLSTFDRRRCDDVVWTAAAALPEGVSVDSATGRVVITDKAARGAGFTLQAKTKLNNSLISEQAVVLGDMLPGSLRFESKAASGLLDREIPMRVYSRDEASKEGINNGILYLLNIAAERVGTESDESILNDYLARGWVVITLDYGNDPRAASPKLEQELHTLLMPGKSNRVWRRLNPQFFEGYEAYIPHRTYILPQGYRVQNDVPYFGVQQHGPHGIMDNKMRDWNQKIAPKRDDVEEITQPSQMKTSDGEPITGSIYVMDIIYPSKPANPVPVVLRFATDIAKDNNAGNTGKRWHFTGFTLRGGAYAFAEHPYDRLYTGGYWKDVGLHCYSHINYLGLSMGQAALRQLNAHKWLYGIDTERVFGHGHSKGQAFVTRMLNRGHQSQAEFKILEGYPKGSPEPHPYQGYPAQLAAGYQSAGWGNFLHNAYDSAGNRMLTPDYLPTLIAVGAEDQENIVAAFHSFVQELKKLGVDNYVDLLMPGVGHEIPNGWNPLKERDNYDLYIEFYERMLD